MRKTTVLFLAGVLLCAAPLYAQKNGVCKNAAKILTRRRPAPLETASAKTAEKAVSALARKTAQARRDALQNQAERSLFLLQSYETSLQGTGFVIEENFDGKTILWGVTASHLLDMFDTRPYITFKINGRPVFFEAGKILRGSRDGADIALLELPPEAARVARPLSVSSVLPRRGHDTFSVGYAHGSYMEARNRAVLESNPERIVTSYEFTHVRRGGYCGSPLFNANNEVVGVHCGSFLKNTASPAWKEDLERAGRKLPDLSLAVPISWARQLLAEYRTPFSGGVPLRFKGLNLGVLGPRQHLLYVTPVVRGKPLQGLCAGPYTDPSHLERGQDFTRAESALVGVYDPGEQNGQEHIIDFLINWNNKTVRRTVRAVSDPMPGDRQ